MKCTEPTQAYVVLYRALQCNEKDEDATTFLRVSAKTAAANLEQRFAKPRTKKRTSFGHSAKRRRTSNKSLDSTDLPVVLLMDELDLLVNRQQSVLYHFFDWPNRPSSRLIVIAVANTMDLPERALQGKVASRLGLVRVNFSPYTPGQLMRIIRSRLRDLNVFDEDAVELCARKVGAVSGDARRALEICRLAVEIFEQDQQDRQSQVLDPSSVEQQEKSDKITMDTVNRAVREMMSSPAVACIRSASLHQQIFLAATVKSIRRSGIGETIFGDVICCQFESYKLFRYVNNTVCCAVCIHYMSQIMAMN